MLSPATPKPLKRIQVSEKDARILGELRAARAPDQAEQPGDYRDKVVVKPWGYEFLVFENPLVAVWFLHIRKDHSTSMHCHPGKRTGLSVLSGKALCNTFHQRNFLSAGDALNLAAGTFHGTKAMSLDGLCLLEVESPNNKSDLVRLEDSYGRQVAGYEGLAQMRGANLEAYRHFFFSPGARPWQVEGGPRTFPGAFSILFEGYEGAEAFRREFRPDSGALYNLCLGRLLDGQDGTVMQPGEVERGSFLAGCAGLAADGPVLLLKIRLFD